MKQFTMDYLNRIDYPVLKAAVIFFLFILLAKITDIITEKIFRKLAARTKSTIDDSIIDLIHRPVFFTVIAIGASQAIDVLQISEKLAFYFNGATFSLISFLWCICIIKVSNLIIKNSVEKVKDITGLSHELLPLAENLWTVLVLVAFILFVLSIWEVNITPLLASAGIVGVAVALAAKDTLANFFGGISVFIDKPYKIGDYIVLDQGERGEVVRIGIRSTRIKTRDDILISIPNSIIANTKIINESAPVPNFRIRVPVSVAYGSDLNTTEGLLMDIAVGNDNIQAEPEPRVRLRALGDSGLNYELLCWAKEPAIRGLTIHELNRTIYNRFNEAGIVIPYPHRTVYVREERQ